MCNISDQSVDSAKNFPMEPKEIDATVEKV